MSMYREMVVELMAYSVRHEAKLSRSERHARSMQHATLGLRCLEEEKADSSGDE